MIGTYCNAILLRIATYTVMQYHSFLLISLLK